MKLLGKATTILDLVVLLENILEVHGDEVTWETSADGIIVRDSDGEDAGIIVI